MHSLPFLFRLVLVGYSIWVYQNVKVGRMADKETRKMMTCVDERTPASSANCERALSRRYSRELQCLSGIVFIQGKGALSVVC
jgi:hypothetical protein